VVFHGFVHRSGPPLAIRSSSRRRRPEGPLVAAEELRARLAAETASTREARKLVEAVVPDATTTVRADAELAVGELVTNAIVHAKVHHDAQIEIVIRRSTELLRVEIHDGDITIPTLRTVDDAVAGGRGLHIVEATTDRWGVQPSPTGKFVWFEIDLSPVDQT